MRMSDRRTWHGQPHGGLTFPLRLLRFPPPLTPKDHLRFGADKKASGNCPGKNGIETFAATSALEDFRRFLNMTVLN